MGMKRSEFLRRMAALGLGAASSGSGLTLLDPTRAFGYALKEHAGETLTVITQDGPPIASAITDSIGPFKDVTGATVKLITSPFGDLYTKTMANFVTGGGSYDAILNPSSCLGDYEPDVVDLMEKIKTETTLDWSEMS